jgi:hypothetical protein
VVTSSLFIGTVDGARLSVTSHHPDVPTSYNHHHGATEDASLAGAVLHPCSHSACLSIFVHIFSHLHYYNLLIHPDVLSRAQKQSTRLTKISRR